LTHTVLLGGKQTYRRYGGGGIPRVFWIDRQGTVADVHLGFGPESPREMEQVIEKMLAVAPA